MYLHIGNGVSIKEENIIGIFDLDTATVSKSTKKFINRKQKEGKVEYTDTDLPRSFIVCAEPVCDKKGEAFIKLSRISSVGLNLRIDGDYKE